MYSVIKNKNGFDTKEFNVDFCVVGGGMAGICAAISAARHGVKVALMNDRPVLGGNASSEIKMWISGAQGKNCHETGIIEEICLENLRINPHKNYSQWDAVLYSFIKNEKNIELILNCSCFAGEMDGNKIQSVTGWQTTTQRYIKVNAKYFADCSGDSVLAPITNATCRVGREAESEFNESLEREEADSCTMGNSCLIVMRECYEPKKYVAPDFARKLTEEDLNHRLPNLSRIGENFWYLELGGTEDTIGDAEKIRDRLLALAYGMVDYIKNNPSQAEKNKNFELDWIGFLPGKRESRRYVGAHILTQNEIMSGGKFDDIIAYGGWPLDDHTPEGFEAKNSRPNIAVETPSPFGIPYGCIYSEEIKNLFFAGRNISVTHAAMSSTRVMGTCSLLGQAVGTAVSQCIKNNVLPGEVNIEKLQDILQYDGCFLPYNNRKFRYNVTVNSDMEFKENLSNGIDRPYAGKDNFAIGNPGCYAEYNFEKPENVSEMRLVFDCDFNRETLPDIEGKLNRNMYMNRLLSYKEVYVPKTIVSDFDVIFEYASGEKETVSIRDNCKYLVKLPVKDGIKKIRVNFIKTRGSEKVKVFAFDFK